MGYGANPNDSDFTIVTVVLQYGVFARDYDGKSLSSTILIQSLTQEFFVHVGFSFRFLKLFYRKATIKKTLSKPFP